MEKSDPIISEENLELPPPAIPMPEVKHEEHKKFMTPQITFLFYFAGENLLFFKTFSFCI